jgi:hypothetical protein
MERKDIKKEDIGAAAKKAAKDAIEKTGRTFSAIRDNPADASKAIAYVSSQISSALKAIGFANAPDGKAEAIVGNKEKPESEGKAVVSQNNFGAENKDYGSLDAVKTLCESESMKYMDGSA